MYIYAVVYEAVLGKSNQINNYNNNNKTTNCGNCAWKLCHYWFFGSLTILETAAAAAAAAFVLLSIAAMCMCVCMYVCIMNEQLRRRCG